MSAQKNSLAALVAISGAVFVMFIIIGGILSSMLDSANKENARLQAELKEQQCMSLHSSLR